jgi:hypothetical protein
MPTTRGKRASIEIPNRWRIAYLREGLSLGIGQEPVAMAVQGAEAAPHLSRYNQPINRIGAGAV